MGFGLPWALAGLLAVGIPILAHLLRRQKLPKQTLPTIAFLHRIHATRAARLRVVDMLLLIARALLVAALVLVAAAPYRLVQSSLLDRQHALAIVFDDSLSMAAIHEGETLIERAAVLSTKQVRKLPEGSEVSVVLSGSPPRVWVRRRSELEMVRNAFGEIDTRSTRGDALCDAVRAAVELLLESELADRRLLVLSDFTSGTRADECEWPTRGIRVGFETVSTPNPDNRRIASVDVIGDRESADGLQLDVQVSGTPTQAQQRVRLRQKGQETQERPVRWTDDGGHAALSIPTHSTDAVVELRLDPDDVLPADNVRGVLLGSDTVHVLLVDGDPHPDPRKRETAFLSHALGVAPRIGRSFAVETLDAQDLSESAIIRSDVLVLANATLDEKWLPLIQRFVSGGGSLWITAGDRINPRAYGSVLRELLPARYTATRMEERPVSFQSKTLPELDQAKVRGFRIELGEIESVLAKHPAVQQAVATVQEISAADRRLVVFFVPAPHLAASVTALRRHARLELPDYMIPQYFVELDSLPVTESGKIDRRALPRAFSIASSAIASVAPRTRTERLVAEIWGEALGVDGIGVHDNFFDLGGHSLLSAQVIARIEKATGAQLSLRTIMLDTLEQLAAAVAAR